MSNFEAPEAAQPAARGSASNDAGVQRRTLVKGAAWAVPVIATAVSLPLAAASGEPVIVAPDTITNWRGDHHYGSNEDDADQRSYDFPIEVKDGAGNPVPGVVVTVVAAGQGSDGPILNVFRYPAPDRDLGNGALTATATTDANGRAAFAVNTQNLSDDELPATATLTISVTFNGNTVTKVVTVTISRND